ncbi:YycH family regulatory protein [Alteribacillus iranensis]|uniref:Two-component signal transduction system YycFG, regulatory protein YycH n=1 Tax=Alteribacillus iranensis TaxID=930128 RepID=A0A1I2C5E7_9BACI|nr:two-component system activity regulator YycH [Alteribacillus iranensis]SFE63043.1 Two-component signal transduction system YycFG, regulatory protein YycH [Alteribacillus iranensis]
MKERIKSWTLTILVAISVFLTWQLWNYQPNYALLDEDTGYVPSENLGKELSLKEVIWPQQLVFHQGVDQHGVDGSDRLLSAFYEDFLDSRFEDITLNQDYEIRDLYDGQREAELVFPAPIPGEALERILDIESDTPYLSIDSVDRIILSDQGGDSENLQVKFVSYSEPVVLEGETNFSLSEFRERYIERMDEFPEVFPYELPGSDFIQKTVYLPAEPITYNSVSDTSTALNYNDFLSLLFSDSDYVRQYHQDNQEASFTDGNRMMSLEDNGDYLTYVNPVYSENSSDNQQHVVTTTFDFVNSRGGGWTDDYRLYDWEHRRSGEHATYRMVVAGLPVFESRGRDLASINVSRSGGQVSEFSRPLFNLDESPIDTQGAEELASGSEVLAYVERQFETDRIENIQVGYQMEKTDNLVIRFEPSWYVKYDGSWYSVEPNKEEE